MIGFGLSIIGVAVLVFIAAFTFDIAMRMLDMPIRRKLMQNLYLVTIIAAFVGCAVLFLGLAYWFVEFSVRVGL